MHGKALIRFSRSGIEIPTAVNALTVSENVAIHYPRNGLSDILKFESRVFINEKRPPLRGRQGVPVDTGTGMKKIYTPTAGVSTPDRLKIIPNRFRRRPVQTEHEHRIVLQHKIRNGLIVEEAEPSQLVSMAIRRVRIRFKEPMDLQALESLAGVTVLAQSNGVNVTVQVEGEMDALVKTLATFPISDFETQHPSLEEIFLAYYKGEEEV